MKRINARKLKAMGTARVEAVCIKHAEIAIRAKESGDTRKFNLHAGLLDQCAAVGRELRGKSPGQRRAKDLLLPLPDGVPCSHPGCASHVTHPCEGCGRIGAQTAR